MPLLPSNLRSPLLLFPVITVGAIVALAAAIAIAQNRRPATSSSSSGAPAAGASATSGAHTWELHRTALTAVVPDLNDPSQNPRPITIPEVSMLVPKGWTAQAGLMGNANPTDCAFNFGRIGIQISSPDHLINVTSLPGQVTFWSNNRGALQQRAAYTQRWNGTAPCVIEQPKTLAQGFPEAARIVFKDGTLEGAVEPVPGLSAELPASLAKANQALAARGSHMEAEAGQALLRGTGPNGAPTEARLILLLTHRFDPAPGGGFIELTDSPLIVLESAPAGQLAPNQRLIDTVLNSIQIAPEYTAYTTEYAAKLVRMRQNAENQVAQIYGQMAQDNARAAADQAAIRNDASNYRSQVMGNVARNRAAALDHSSQQFALSMNDQALYHDGSGHTVQLPNQYGHVWASSTGNSNDYILTDSSSYNPNGHAGSAGWTELQPVH